MVSDSENSDTDSESLSSDSLEQVYVYSYIAMDTCFGTCSVALMWCVVLLTD